MVEMRRGLDLHSRSCRGEILSDEERAELGSWYAEQDAEEAAALKFNKKSPSVDELRTLLESEVRALRQTVEDIQTIHNTNETLRQEIAALKHRFAESTR